MKRVSLIVLLGAAVSAPTSAVGQKLAPLCSDGVKVFYAPSKVGKEYQQVAWLDAKRESGYDDEAMILKKQRRTAANLGANGVIVGGWEELHPAKDVREVGLRTERGDVLAIYIPGDSSRVKAACKGTDNR